MKTSRREFLKISVATGAGLFLGRLPGFKLNSAYAFYNSNGLQKFVQPLRGVFPLDPNGIPVAVPDGSRAWGSQTAAHYTIDINQYTDTLHPDLGPTILRGYHSRANLGGTPPQRHLGGIIVAQKGKPVQITFQNNLTGDHPLPVDTTIMGADLGPNRVVPHLHGGEVPWISDGGPFAWFDNQGGYGSSVQAGPQNNIYKTLNPGLQAGQAEFYYPNRQSARFAWYHDHAVGITRLNAYAGIASGYIIRDAFEGFLRNLGLPDFIENGGREIPLIFQDKIFVGADIGTVDPGWAGPRGVGSLWYPHTYDRWDSWPGSTQPDPTVVPEMFGDTMLVNGVAYPRAAIEPRRYRLRILNACQARFLNLQLYEDNGFGQPDLAKPGPAFIVIGTEGGFLTHPAIVPSNQPLKYLPDGASVDPANPGGSLITGPGERWDVIVDFMGFAGKKFILYNDAPAPFPMGDPVNDYQSAGGAGPDTRTIMRFEVAAGITGKADLPLRITTRTPLSIDPAAAMAESYVGRWAAAPLLAPGGVKVRKLTLNEVFDDRGRLIQMLGTNEQTTLPTGFNTSDAEVYARAYDDTATETPQAGKVEVWQIANLTGDTHPMHFHLVNVQILSRQPFASYANGQPGGLGAARGPEPTELGWKETVKMHPGEVTTIVMKFDIPSVPFAVPSSPRTGGAEYVWHCHILDHEEHDMMRPMVVS
jgi:spore coat protein A